VSLFQLGRATQGRGLAPVITNEADNLALAPQRAAQTRLEDMRSGTERLRGGLVTAQTGAANASAGASGASAGAANALRDLRKRTDPNIRAGVDKDGNPIVTEVEESRHVAPEDQLIAAQVIAQAARKRGATTPQQIAKVADDMGYELEGDASISGDEGTFGMFKGAPALTGDFSLKPKGKTKTTTKGKGTADKPAPAQKAAAPQQDGPETPDQRRARLRGILGRN
jgi:hypothetical protein